MDDGYGTYAVEAEMADERTACVVQMSDLCMRESMPGELQLVNNVVL